MPGPAPKPAGERVRRNAPMANTVKLPSEGRTKPAPIWPFGDEPPAIWAELWSTPQAVAWERLGWTRVVARYCRVVAAAEAQPDKAAIQTAALQMEDRLGLTPMSMLRLRWEVVSDEVAEKRAQSAEAKSRPKVVADAVAGA